MHISSAKKPVDVYLVSSTLHFFWSYVLAKKNHAQRDSYLLLIDQYTHKPMVFNAFLTGAYSPFLTTELMAGRELTGLQKWRNRNKQFTWITHFTQSHRIDKVFIGNDRSVLGQFFIKQAKMHNKACLACYLDEGVFTYLGRAASQKVSERYIDALIKKITYGFWYDPPQTIGASKWIDQAWVMYPSHVNDLLKTKELVEIYPDNNGFEELAELAEIVLLDAGVSLQKLAKLDVLITLPNQTLFSKIADYEKNIVDLMMLFEVKGYNVAVKYHPAAGESDPLQLEHRGAWRLPGGVSFEMLLPFLKQCTLIGDISTTVLLAHYTQSVNKVVMLKHSDDRRIQEMVELCQRLSINVLDIGHAHAQGFKEL
jgi:hypothetical protein